MTLLIYVKEPVNLPHVDNTCAEVSEIEETGRIPRSSECKSKGKREPVYSIHI